MGLNTTRFAGDYEIFQLQNDSNKSRSNSKTRFDSNNKAASYQQIVIIINGNDWLTLQLELELLLSIIMLMTKLIRCHIQI